ncbi:hypothetical protein [Dendronalium sp. ChiSLP03b]|nr:hypothetical protein [Dendronalium sp. ChiSLP03b]
MSLNLWLIVMCVHDVKLSQKLQIISLKVYLWRSHFTTMYMPI